MTDLKAPQARKVGGDFGPVFFASPYPYYRDEDSVSLIDLASFLRAEWRLMATVVVLAGLVSLAVAFLMTPVYRAEVLIAPVSPNRHDGIPSLIGELGGLSTLLQGYIAGPSDRSAELIAVLRSRSVASRFIADRNLKPHLFSERWNAKSQTWDSGSPVPSDAEAYDVFKGVRNITVDRGTRLVTVAMEWSDPQLAARWANDYVAQVNEQQRADAVRDAQQNIKYLQQQLAQNSSVEVRQAIYGLIEAEMKKVALARARAEYAFKIIDPAVVPESRARPHRRMIVIGGLVLGILLAVAAILGRRALQTSRRSADPLV